MRKPATRATAAGALILTAAITIALVGVEHGRLAYNTRVEPSLLLRWAARSADLPRALPAWSLDEGKLYRDVATWCAAALLAWAILRRIGDAVRSRAALAVAAAGAFGAAAMAAATVTWNLGGIDGTVPLPGQMALLRRAPEPRALFGGLSPPRIVAREALPQELRLRLELLPAGDRPEAVAEPLFVLPGVPAGEYRLRPRARGAGGTLSIAIGRDNNLLHAVPTTAPEPFMLRLPIDVRGVVIRGDEPARGVVRGLTIEPVSLVPASRRLSRAPAGRAARYGGTVVYFLDERCFPERDAFWIGGSRETSIVLAPDALRAATTILVRNAPVENRVLVESGGWREELRMAPGEERRVEVPIDPGRGGALVRFGVSSGFRPSGVDPASLDHRFLGAWIKVL